MLMSADKAKIVNRNMIIIYFFFRLIMPWKANNFILMNDGSTKQDYLLREAKQHIRNTTHATTANTKRN